MKKAFFTVLMSLMSLNLFGQAGRPERIIKDNDITGAMGNVYWSKDTVYLLDGFVYVEEPAVLHIPAGTVIKGKESPTTGDVGTALIICRGAKIIAEGTETEPIIFTSEYDDTDLPDNGADPKIDWKVDKGLWGGVVLLGNARLNVADEKVVEGLPATDPRALYGRGASNFNDEDSSGVMRYVSIRYTGVTVEANKELQGLTLGCVGSKTVIEYIESFCSDDDGFEWFGGTVNTKYLVAAYCEDDGFDYDQGFRGKGQFWFAIQDTGRGDYCGEWDSGDAGALTNTPLSNAIIYNATFLGQGESSSKGNYNIKMKEYGSAKIYNSIFTEMSKKFVSIDSGAGSTSYNRFLSGDIIFENNIVYKSSASNWLSLCHHVFEANYLQNPSNNNILANPQLTNLNHSAANNSFDPRPLAGGLAYTHPRKEYTDSWFTQVDYVGAFGNDLWIKNWTALCQNNISVATGIIETKGKNIPQEYQLMQNYPNPFNPTTNIQFAIPDAGNVKLTIYNILGQEITTLVNSYKDAGNYTITWNASDLASGIYIYKLESNSKVLINKMTLMK